MSSGILVTLQFSNPTSLVTTGTHDIRIYLPNVSHQPARLAPLFSEQAGGGKLRSRPPFTLARSRSHYVLFQAFRFKHLAPRTANTSSFALYAFNVCSSSDFSNIKFEFADNEKNSQCQKKKVKVKFDCTNIKVYICICSKGI